MEEQDGSEDVEVTGLSLDAVSQEGACTRNKADEQIKQGLMDTEGRPRGAGAEGAGELGERGEGWESQNSPRDGKPSTENPVTNVVRSMDAAGGVRDLSGESVCKLCNCLKHYGIHWKLI